MKFCKATKSNLKKGSIVQRRNGENIYGELLEVSFLHDEIKSLKNDEVICRSPSGNNDSVKNSIKIENLAKVCVEELYGDVSEEESMAEYFKDLVEQENDLRRSGIIR